MDQIRVRSATRRRTKVVIHIDIWEAIFDQLVVLGYLRTLANCAQLNWELSWLALPRLYKDQFSSSASWGTQLADVLWTTLWTSALSTEGPPTTQPYVNYIRHLDFLNFLSIRNCRDFPHPHFITAALQQANHQNFNSTNDPDIVVANQITAQTPSIGVLALRLLRDLCCMAQRRDLRVMLKSLTIDKWAHVLPVIRSLQELETLSLVFMEGLDASAAELLTRYLPRLSGIELVQASVPHTLALASFLSHLKPDQLRGFSCSLNRIQVPVLWAIPKQTNLQKLSLKFLIRPPVEMHRLFELQALTELNLSFNFIATRPAQAEFRDWATRHRGNFANWLKSCENLRSLHLFRFPDLVPAIADALPRLHLNRLHIFSTGLCRDFYEALGTQRLEYLFLAESPDMLLVNPPLGWRERDGMVMDAVAAMPGLRDLRLHTYFPLGYKELEHIARHVPKLQTIFFLGCKEENPTWTLRALVPFRHLTSLTVLGRTKFSSRQVLQWIDYTQCHLRPGGFSLSLPAQDSWSWSRGFRVSNLIADPATEDIRHILRFLIVYSRENNYRGEIWRGNDYEFDEERMFVHLWDDIRGPAEALQLLRGSGPYPPFLGLMENMGARIASSD
ncbi:hypothetical protein LY78DRAFT_709550 [Colletotrichum sublineola]|uniref:F-box domain-containing protein n=1 Tax=Colletotrichum sublineola TaxID=1173701 RepID=A0A066Y170_COLSU|nr:hypothetical protein LY78DRAFT_709550 [Colletotrichum sublineola]KDN71980.1 hypothetical protein CSUB01_07295 [Colletotrichum sublineola]